MREENIRANGGVRANDRFATEDSGIRINRHIVFDIRMALAAFDNVPGHVFDKAPRAERYPVVELHMVANIARLPDDYPGAMINEKMRADGGAGMDVDARPAVGPLGHHARHHGGRRSERAGAPAVGWPGLR